jgi:hypothetical protein
MADDRDARIAALENQVITLGTRLNQFYRLLAAISHSQYADKPNVDQETMAKLIQVIKGEKRVEDWALVQGEPLNPRLAK